MTLLLIALASFFFTEFSKAAIPFALPAWAKLTLGLIGALLVAAMVGEDMETHTRFACALAGTGLAMVVHKLHRLLSAVGDVQRLQLLAAGRRYPSRTG